jgi:hypothetical protein
MVVALNSFNSSLKSLSLQPCVDVLYDIHSARIFVWSPWDGFFFIIISSFSVKTQLHGTTTLRWIQILQIRYYPQVCEWSECEVKLISLLNRYGRRRWWLVFFRSSRHLYKSRPRVSAGAPTNWNSRDITNGRHGLCNHIYQFISVIAVTIMHVQRPSDEVKTVLFFVQCVPVEGASSSRECVRARNNNI